MRADRVVWLVAMVNEKTTHEGSCAAEWLGSITPCQ
jgi:hypothetical protein